ncbi:MAG: ribonuclease III [Pseudomonadota bacterium]
MSAVDANDRATLVAWFDTVAGYRFLNSDSLLLALVHRSVGHENNERLEFLGDAVLDTVVSHRLYALRPDADEGELSRVRSVLVREVSLATIAEQLGIDQHLLLGPGERKSGGHRRASILADTLEALLGAVFLDGGYPAAERVIDRWFTTALRELPANAALKDPKTRLQEWLQQRAAPLPSYRVIAVSGAAHEQRFEVECELVDRQRSFSASGTSRRKAEQRAASAALDYLENK